MPTLALPLPFQTMSKRAKKLKPERPAWIPASIKENWDPNPYAYQTEEELMPAGGLHGQILTEIVEVVKAPLKQQGLMFLIDTFMLYRDKDHRRDRVAPDLLLMPSIFPAPSSYDLDKKPPPSLVVEVTSPKSHFSDLKKKVSFYFNLGIETYLVIDAITPKSQLREPIELHLWHREKGQSYQKMSPDSEGYLLLPALNIKIAAQGQDLILVDRITGERLRDTVQLRRALKKSEQLAKTEAQRAVTAQQRAEAEAQRAVTAEQRAETEALRAVTAEQRAETEAQRAVTAEQRAETEAQRANIEAQRANDAVQQAARERQRAKKLAQLLRAQGIEVDEI